MKRLACFFCMALCTVAFSAYAYLVTPEEMRTSNDAPLQIIPRTSPVKDAPLIEVITPKLPGSVSSPTPIDLKFQAIAPSNVKPDSFKALYGTFQIDITKRLLSVAKVTETGVQVQDATLPKGRHKILLLIEDSAGRPGSRMLEFDVQ